MTRTATRLASAEITPVIRRVSLLVEFDAKKSQAVANPGADRGRVLADAAGEHQRVQSAQRRGEGADPFLDLVAKQRDRFGRPHVLRFTVEQVAHVGTGLRNAEQPGLEIDHLVELLRVICSVRARYQTSPGSRSPERVLIGTPAVGVKLMLVSMDLPSRTAARLAPLPRWARITRPCAASGSGQAGQFFHQKRIGQPVKPVAPHPLRFVAARDRQQLGHARQVMVKSRVETGHLRQVGKAAMKRLGQQDLLRQMLGIERTEPVQLLDHFRRDALRLAVLRPAMHHAMPHRGQRIAPDAFLDPIHQHAHRRRVIRRRHRPRKVVRRVHAFHPQGGLRQSNPLDRALQNPPQRVTGLEQRELDARRAAIDRQDAWVSWFHG